MTQEGGGGLYNVDRCGGRQRCLQHGGNKNKGFANSIEEILLAIRERKK
jgi:hypothetical protein